MEKDCCVSQQKKHRNDDAKAGDSGGTEGRETSQLGRPKRVCISDGAQV